MKHDFFIHNRERLIELLPENSNVILWSGDYALYSNDVYYPFRVESNFYYLSGIQEAGCAILIKKHNDGYHETLFIPKYDEKYSLREGEILDMPTARSLSGIQDIHTMQEFDEILNKAVKYSKTIYTVKHVYESGYALPSWSEKIRIRDEVDIQHINTLTAPLRIIKTDDEIAQIQQAVKITKNALQSIEKMIVGGVNEQKIQSMLHASMLEQGSHRSFPAIVASGVNTCVLHYTRCDNILKSGDILLIDTGAVSNLYAGDLTRCFAIDGTMNKRQREVYDAVERIQQFAINILRPGIQWGDYNQQVHHMMREELMKLGLIRAEDVNNQDDVRKKYFPHGVSHSLGLDVHDPALYDKNMIIEESMVFTVEPGIYIAEEGIGIRLEKDVVIGAKSIVL